MRHGIRLVGCLLLAALILALIISGSWATPRVAAAALNKAQVTVVSATPALTVTSGPIRRFIPTNTPRPTRTPTPGPTEPALTARLCVDCTRVRLRATPGTAGEILSVLDENAQLNLIGRTADNKWVQVLVLPGGVGGWVSTQFLRLPDFSVLPKALLDKLPVQGVAIEASPTPTSAAMSGVPSYLSGLSSRTREIYLRGQNMGNRANVFSKIGDSITVSPNFLYPVGYGQYDLGQYGGLAGVVGYFLQANARTGNSFANQSLAAGGGWTSDKLLTPGYGFPEVCGSETPLVCEYQRVKPAVALILIGTNDSGSGSVENFAGNMRQIIETSINMGVIPVISTLPPKNIDDNQEGRVNAFNDAIRLMAAQYQIPLWDYYAQMAGAQNRGMSSDGLHPSASPDGAAARFTPDNLQYGYNIRNLGALQVLDALWRYVMY